MTADRREPSESKPTKYDSDSAKFCFFESTSSSQTIQVIKLPPRKITTNHIKNSTKKTINLKIKHNQPTILHTQLLQKHPQENHFKKPAASHSLDLAATINYPRNNTKIT